MLKEALVYIYLFETQNPEEEKAIKEQLIKVVEYLIAIKTEVRRDGIKNSDVKMNLELVCYMTVANLEPGHKFLAM